MPDNPFHGTIPALMTPCTPARAPDFDALARTGRSLIDAGMRAVVYCGSMGDWPLLSDDARMRGVERLIAAGVPTIVGTGAQSPARAAALAAHAKKAGAAGLMVIPRVLSRGSSAAAQRAHFEGILGAAPKLPAVIYNSPYYGYETKADLFFQLRRAHPNLVGFKEFGGAASLRYAAEYIVGEDPGVSLLVGVDTQVFHGYVNCGAVGAITGIGNVLPREVLQLEALCRRGAAGDATARAGTRARRGARRAVVVRRGRRPGALLQAPDGARGQCRVRAPPEPDRPALGEPGALRGAAARSVQGVVPELAGGAVGEGAAATRSPSGVHLGQGRIAARNRSLIARAVAFVFTFTPTSLSSCRPLRPAGPSGACSPSAPPAPPSRPCAPTTARSTRRAGTPCFRSATTRPPRTSAASPRSTAT